MALRARIEHNNFSAGELSPWLRNRTNLDRYANGAKAVRNFVCLPEGGLTRRPGTRFIRAQKTEAELGAVFPFRYSGADNYTLVLNGGAIRFVRAQGVVLDAGNPYEVAIPWASADLANVRMAQEGNSAWFCCAGFEPRKLTRGSSHIDWTLALYRPTGGPVKIQNLDTAKTILASARTGTGISLSGVGTAFAATDVASIMRLDESDLSLTPNWKASETLTLPTEALPVSGTKIGDMASLGNAFDGNPATAASKTAASGYIGVNEATPSSIFSVRVIGTNTGAGGADIGLTLKLYAKVGGAPASETNGTVLASAVVGGAIVDATLTSPDQTSTWDYWWVTWTVSGGSGTVTMKEITGLRFTASGTPVLRRYNGNVYQAISGSATGLTPPTHTEGDVQSEPGATGVIWRFRHGPYGMVRITAVADATHATADVLKTLPDSVIARATYRWWPGAWNGADGWPEQVLRIDRGLLFMRGADWWMTTVDSDDDFEVTALPDSAIAQQLRSRNGGLPTIEWALDNGVIVLGCRDNEIIVRAPGTFEALDGTNVRAPMGSQKGSAPHVPAAVEAGVIFISRSRKNLFFAAFDADTQKLAPSEVSISGRHLLRALAGGLAWQPDPWNVLWGYCQDGSLFALTFNIEHKIAGMHAHPLVNGIVEAMCAMPSSDEGVSEVTMIVRRTINGSTRRYIEQLGSYFEDSGSGDATGAWFFDSALSYSGASTTTISGLSHLALEEVGILADNAAHERKTVSAGGQVTLDRACTAAVIGLPIDAQVVDLPRNITLPRGSTKGDRKRASHALVDVVDTIGGTLACNGGNPEPLQLTGSSDYGAAPALATACKRVQMVGPLGDEAELTLTASDGMPMTITGLAPDIDVMED